MSKLTIAAAAVAVALAAAPAGAQTSEDMGTIAFDSDGVLFTAPAEAGAEPQVVEPDDDVADAFRAHPALSPDETTIAFTRTVDDNADVWTMKVDGSGPQRLTEAATADSTPAWSPDGSRLAFTRVRDEKPSVFVTRADGTRVRRVTPRSIAAAVPDWSPSGRRLAFAGTRNGNTDVYSVRLDGTRLRRLTRAPGVDASPAWSPDGRSIAYVGIDGVLGTKPFVVGPRGGGRTRVPLSDCDDECHLADVAWSPDGSALAVAYAHEEDFAFRIVAVGSDGTETEYVSRGHSIGSLSWR